MANAWIKHLTEVRKKHAGMSLKDAMKKAKQTYKKSPLAAVAGKTMKNRKQSKHPNKGKKSRTRKGRLDFVTHKGDKDFNKGNKRQHKSRKPYRKGKKAGNVISKIDDAINKGLRAVGLKEKPTMLENVRSTVGI